MAKIKLLGYPAVVAGFKEKEIKIDVPISIRPSDRKLLKSKKMGIKNQLLESHEFMKHHN